MFYSNFSSYWFIRFHLVSDTELDNLKSFNTTKSETTNDLDLSETGNDDRRRSSRTTTQKNYAKQEDDDDEESDDEDLYENGRPPPRRMRYKKRRGSDDSFVDDDDDYEKLQRKRKIVKYGKSISRSSITDHLKKLVDEDGEPIEGKRSGMNTIFDLLHIHYEDRFLNFYSLTITRCNTRRY